MAESAYTFKSDTAKLKQYLLGRKKSMETVRTYNEAKWKELREYFEPNIGKSLLDGDPDQLAALNEDSKILNSAPRRLVGRLSAGLQSGITNPARRWFQMKMFDDKLSDQPAVRQWLNETTDTLSDMMNRSNVYMSLGTVYKHCGVMGTSCGIIYENEDSKVYYEVIDEGDYWISQNISGRVDTLLHRKNMTLANCVEKFGIGWLPGQYRTLYEKGTTEHRITLYNYVSPHKPDLVKDIGSDRAFMSIWFMTEKDAKDNDGIIAIRSFSYNPIIAPRWDCIGSVYGVGPGHEGLADAKQLQTMEEDKLEIVEKDADPPMAAPSSMKGTPIPTHAGGLTWYDEIGQKGQSPVQRLYKTDLKVEGLIMTIQEVEERLKITFYSNLFAMMIEQNLRPKQMTAREVNELSSEKVALLGPVLTRLNNDLLNPLIDALFAIALDANMLKPPPKVIEGHELKVEYVSMLHVEQTATHRLSGLYRLFEFVGGVAQLNPTALDKIDTDKAIDIAAKSLVEYGVVRGKEDVAALRKARAEEARKQREAELQTRQAPAMAKAARDMSETRLGTGSALDATLQAGGAA